jgi:hypothetical protein
MPVCSYFLEGRCGAAACPYNHVRVSPSAPLCAAFRSGFCPRGLACELRHSLLCPSLQRGGACSNRARCRFHHPAPAAGAQRAAPPPAGPAGAAADPAPPPAKRPRHSMLPAFAREPRAADDVMQPQ